MFSTFVLYLLLFDTFYITLVAEAKVKKKGSVRSKVVKGVTRTIGAAVRSSGLSPSGKWAIIGVILVAAAVGIIFICCKYSSRTRSPKPRNRWEQEGELTVPLTTPNSHSPGASCTTAQSTSPGQVCPPNQAEPYHFAQGNANYTPIPQLTQPPYPANQCFQVPYPTGSTQPPYPVDPNGTSSQIPYPIMDNMKYQQTPYHTPPSLIDKAPETHGIQSVVPSYSYTEYPSSTAEQQSAAETPSAPPPTFQEATGFRYFMEDSSNVQISNPDEDKTKTPRLQGWNPNLLSGSNL